MLFSFNFYGAKCRVFSQNTVFERILRDTFEVYKEGATQSLINSDIAIKVKSGKAPRFLETEIISEKYLKSSSQLRIRHSYLGSMTTVDIHFSKTAKNLRGVSFYYNPSLIFHFLNAASRGLLHRQLVRQLVKLYIEQSLLWEICRQKKLNCLHASSVLKNKKAYLLAGLNGVGKSTLAHWLAKKYDYKVVADNYVLVGSNTMYVSPDKSRFSLDSIRMLGYKAGPSFGFGKQRVEEEVSSKPTKTSYSIAGIYITTRADGWNKEKISAAAASKILPTWQAVDSESIEFAPISLFQPTSRGSFPDCAYFTLAIGDLKELKDTPL